MKNIFYHTVLTFFSYFEFICSKNGTFSYILQKVKTVFPSNIYQSLFESLHVLKIWGPYHAPFPPLLSTPLMSLVQSYLIIARIKRERGRRFEKKEFKEASLHPLVPLPCCLGSSKSCVEREEAKN